MRTSVLWFHFDGSFEPLRQSFFTVRIKVRGPTLSLLVLLLLPLLSPSYLILSTILTLASLCYITRLSSITPETKRNTVTLISCCLSFIFSNSAPHSTASISIHRVLKYIVICSIYIYTSCTHPSFENIPSCSPSFSLPLPWLSLPPSWSLLRPTRHAIPERNVSETQGKGGTSDGMGLDQNGKTDAAIQHALPTQLSARKTRSSSISAKARANTSRLLMAPSSPIAARALPSA